MFWNIVAQAEARKHVLTKLFGGHRYTACYALAATIFLLGLNRDALFQAALQHQPVAPALQYAEVKVLAAVLFAIGSTLVATSMWSLGITGTFLGDYFGILMDVRGFDEGGTERAGPCYHLSVQRVRAPNVRRQLAQLPRDRFVVRRLLRAASDPRRYGTPAGIALSAVVFVVYRIAASRFEGPFTQTICASGRHSGADLQMLLGTGNDRDARRARASSCRRRGWSCAT